ncbi:RagB/SusD family nutrient uptake outer membrane protein [Sphingobacterium faecale]|uniref:RagB/SusD family nutrient uptake outer membrane protein n=1 Tax=Sphingobacterium faecale TaxID=2803775 RepID=A0ABS1R3A4_9SPHI|nr:RagB/SusD family nutrient uptake outer membrane protein [Sphingobacterium faecale]MBL1409183.1 RagB/SusD family nutrient uptake outer membrane protein [Sphingobacterium faecale]
MKNKINLYSIILCIALFSNCSKWLDVKPSDQLTDAALFSEGTGFRNALNGIYQYISEGDLYGRNLSWGLNSALAQDYIGTDISSEYRLAATTFNHNEQAVINIGTNIWGNAYRAIANSNKLIKEIEKKDTSIFRFGKTERDLILGEALALRGVLHFEILRLFATSPSTNSTNNAIPYVDTYPAYFTAPKPMEEVFRLIEKDLKQAKELVATNDTILNRSSLSGKLSSRLSGNNEDERRFFSFRMMRLNHVAISGYLSRVYLYSGKLEEAEQEAGYVYKEFGPHGTKRWFEFTTSTNATGVNKYIKFADDVLFASYNTDLVRNIQEYKDKESTIRYRINKEVSSWFPANERDYRSNLLKQDAVVSTDFISEKWTASSSTGQFRPQQNTMVPILRLSEVYYIYSEALFKNGKVNEALAILNQIRLARGRMTTYSETDEGAFYTELINEYRREFLTEGQTIFAHKRLNRPIQLGSQTIPIDSRFTLAIPDGELIF